MVYLSNINLNKNELQNARIQNLAVDPASPITGQIWYNTASNELKYFDGTIAKNVPQDALVGSSAPTTATVGKVGQFYLDATNTHLYVCTSASSTYTWTKLLTSAESVPFETDVNNLKANGTASLGSSGNVVNSDHVHPTDTTRLAVNPDGTHNLITAQNKIDMSYIPDSIIGQMEYKGTFDASTGGSITGLEKGWYYIATVAGNKNPDASASSVDYAIGDWAVYNGTFWDKIDNTSLVKSVNGQIGNVETYKGAWTSSTAYYKGDVVKYDGVLYVCNESHTSGEAFDTTKFEACGKTYTASAGITLDGSEFKHTNSVTAQSTEAVYPITIDAQGHITSYGTAKTLLTKYTGTITGDATTTAFTITHNLGTQDVTIMVYDSSNEVVIVDAVATSVNAVTITFASAPANATTYKVVIIG